MAHITSDIGFKMWSFTFRKAVTYDNFSLIEGSQTMDSGDLPGLDGDYRFSSVASLWDGPTTLANASNFYSYTGNALEVTGDGAPYAGTVTGLFVGSRAGRSAIVDVSINAADIRVATLNSDSRDDDLAILRAALAGDDTAVLSDFDDYIYMQTGHDHVMAGAGNDTIAGMQGRDTLYGEDGNDLISGGYGSDRLFGGRGRDTIHGDDGNDRLIGNQDKDFLFGGNGNDWLDGGYGYDRLSGGSGADTIIGGSGADTMFGGADAVRDVFVFKGVTDSNLVGSPDIVHNFRSGVDMLDLSAIDANSAATGNQTFLFSGQNAQANSIWYDPTGASVIVVADVNGDAVADFWLRVTQVSSLAAGDFAL